MAKISNSLLKFLLKFGIALSILIFLFAAFMCMVAGIATGTGLPVVLGSIVGNPGFAISFGAEMLSQAATISIAVISVVASLALLFACWRTLSPPSYGDWASVDEADHQALVAKTRELKEERRRNDRATVESISVTARDYSREKRIERQLATRHQADTDTKGGKKEKSARRSGLRP